MLEEADPEYRAYPATLAAVLKIYIRTIVLTKHMTKTRKPKLQKRCIFCDLPKKMSSEHIWGKWLKDYVRADRNKHHIHLTRIPSPNLANISELRIRAGDPIRANVRVVCEGCNNTWLSQIQESTKPILIPLIQGKKSVLGLSAQAQLAKWCTMATMTGEFLDRDPLGQGVSLAERQILCKHSDIPPNWRIWIARYRRYKWKGEWIHLSLPILDAENSADLKPGDPAPPNTQTTTFVIGELYIHVMSSTGHPDLTAKWAWPPFSRISRLLIQIWPPKESFIAWPPESLTDRDADTIPTLFANVIDAASRSLLGRRIF